MEEVLPARVIARRERLLIPTVNIRQHEDSGLLIPRDVIPDVVKTEHLETDGGERRLVERFELGPLQVGIFRARVLGPRH